MQGNSLHKYIAEFEHLQSKAGWTTNDISMITQFWCGLNTRLLKAIVQHVQLCLHMLCEWFDAMQKQHDI
jgi:hypothetical protein